MFNINSTQVSLFFLIPFIALFHLYCPRPGRTQDRTFERRTPACHGIAHHIIRQIILFPPPPPVHRADDLTAGVQSSVFLPAMGFFLEVFFIKSLDLFVTYREVPESKHLKAYGSLEN